VAQLLRVARVDAAIEGPVVGDVPGEGGQPNDAEEPGRRRGDSPFEGRDHRCLAGGANRIRLGACAC